MSDQKGFNKIVPDQNERIGHRRSASADSRPTRQKPVPAPTGGGGGVGGFWKTLVIILLLVVAAAGWFGWQQYQQLNTLQASFDELNSRLADTGDSLSKSGAALSLKINEQQDALEKHWSEIRKLWGVSNDRNKKQIDKNQKSASTNKTRLVNLEKAMANLSNLGKQQQLNSTKIADISSNSLAVAVDIESLQERLRDTVDQLNTVEQTLKQWQGRLSSNEEAVEAIDTYRRQINQELLQLRKQLSTGGGASPPGTGQ